MTTTGTTIFDIAGRRVRRLVRTDPNTWPDVAPSIADQVVELTAAE